MKQILLIGCGNMGRSMLLRLINQPDTEFSVVDPNVESLPGEVKLFKNQEEIGVKKFDIIIIAIKPQMISTILPSYQNHLNENGMVISIVAGTSIATINRYFPNSAIIRVMPSLTASVGKSINGTMANEITSKDQMDFYIEFFSRTGQIIWLENEDEINKITAIAGSGPGFMFYFMESFIKAGQDLGFSYNDSKKMVLNILAGATEMAQIINKEPAELRESVTSKNGTTEAGLNELMKDNQLESLLDKTLKSAYNRALELSKEDS